MAAVPTWLIEPGFFQSQPVDVALTVGGATALVCAVVGVFTVMRGQSFAGHALADVSTAGGSAAFLIGISPVLGFILFGLAGAGAMDSIGVRRVRGRDLATGIVLGASLGLAALFLYEDTTLKGTSAATQQVLFGSIFALAPDTLPVVVGFGTAAMVVIALLNRPLLLDSVDPDLATVRGVRVHLVSLGFMMALAVAVGLSAISIGAILSTALLIGPAATALRVTRRMGRALLLASVFGVLATWLGVLLAYDSYDWGRSHEAVPVSFFVVVLVYVGYVAASQVSRRFDRRRGT